MSGGSGIEVVEVASLEPLPLFDFQQRLVFSPAARGEGFIKLAVTTGQRGAKSQAHSHPRDEVTLTLSGEAVLRAAGKSYLLREGTAVRIPPNLDHSVEVISEEWCVVAAYCDECSLCRRGDQFAGPPSEA